MLNNLKNWWLQILAIVVALLDAGFDIINPALELLNLSDRTINFIKFAFLIGAIIRTKLEPPTKNPEKLQKIVDKQIADAPEGDPIPGKGPKG